jgi:hypothetical protein
MKKVCESCGGSGQSSYFKGQSRFLLSHDDCPNCCGTGYVETSETTPDDPPDIANDEREKRCE